jgi:hypothetical protein
MELLGEMRLTAESGLESYFRQREVGPLEQMPGHLDPSRYQVLMRGKAERGFEYPRETGRAHAGQFCEFIDGDALRSPGFHALDRAQKKVPPETIGRRGGIAAIFLALQQVDSKRVGEKLREA